MGNLSKHTLCLELFCFHKLALSSNKMVCLKRKKKGKKYLHTASGESCGLSWWFPSLTTFCFYTSLQLSWLSSGDFNIREAGSHCVFLWCSFHIFNSGNAFARLYSSKIALHVLPEWTFPGQEFKFEWLRPKESHFQPTRTRWNKAPALLEGTALGLCPEGHLGVLGRWSH